MSRTGAQSGLPRAGMPLTAQLSHPESPVTKFLTQRLPGWRTIASELRDALGQSSSTLRPDGERPAYSTLGRTVEYRLLNGIGYQPQYELPGVPLPGLVRSAVRGVHNAAGMALRLRETSPQEAMAWRGIYLLGVELSKALAQIPAQPLDGGDDEDRLIRLLYVQSHFEDMFRGGPSRAKPLMGVTSLEDLVGTVPDYAVRDVAAMTRRAEPVWGPWADLSEDQKFFNPSLGKSLGVPSDGDVVVDGVLLDVKTTINPTRIGAQEIYQLTGYLLLDTEDAYGMQGCGLYLPRQGLLAAWPLDQFLGNLCGFSMSGATARRALLGLRRDFRASLAEQGWVD